MILLDSVTKRYSGDARPALDDVSLHIEPNEFVFLVGKSGAGKSTLIKMLTKEETPDSGKIIVGGIDLSYVKKRHVPGYRRRLGVVFQDFKLLPRRTVYENVAFALEIIGMSGKEIRKTVPKVLELVDLLDQANKFPDQLSGGQRQRVGIARSVARQPKILIADEPTGQIDKLTTAEIIDLLRKINDFGTTILVTTHDENIVNNLQKRVVTLKDGRIVNDQKVNGVYELGEKPIPEKPVRVLQAPGHALKRSLVFEETKAEKKLDELNKVEDAPRPVEAPKVVKTPKVAKVSVETGKKPVIKTMPKPAAKTTVKVTAKPTAKPTVKPATKTTVRVVAKPMMKVPVPRTRSKTMPNMLERTTVKKPKIAKSNVI